MYLGCRTVEHCRKDLKDREPSFAQVKVVETEKVLKQSPGCTTCINHDRKSCGN